MTAGVIDNLVVTAAEAANEVWTYYNFRFTPKRKIPAGGYIYITFPSDPDPPSQNTPLGIE